MPLRYKTRILMNQRSIVMLIINKGNKKIS